MGTEPSRRLARDLLALARAFDLVAIYAFGSRADEIGARVAGDPAAPTPLTAESDVDIGVLPERDRHLRARERVQIMQALEDLLDVVRIDLVILPEARTFVALDAVTGELLVTTDPDAEAYFQLYVLRKAGDLAEWERERRRMIAAGEAV